MHITPFNESLYGTILAPRLQPLATDLSYHTVQTDATGGGFGYIELPTTEATALRNKFNGATLRGKKIRIEVAKPEKRKRVVDPSAPADADADAQDEDKPKKKKVRKTKRKDGEFEGFELPEGREVKRGWTEEPSKTSHKPTSKEAAGEEGKKPAERKRKREKSKFTTGKEVLFKTSLPEQAVGIAVEAAQKEKKDKKAKKLKKTKGKNEVVIHEFEKNVQFPSFLRAEKTGTGKVAVEFVQGKGWVDEDGNVVESVVVKPKREDRLASMPENKVERLNGDESEDDHVAANPDGKSDKVEKKRKVKQSKMVYMDDDDQVDTPVQDEKTKDELARIDKLLDEESDGDEEFNDAKSDAASEVESDSDGRGEDAAASASGPKSASDSDEEQEGDTHEADNVPQLAHSGTEADVAIETESAKDEDMADALDSRSSDDGSDEELAESESGKKGTAINADTPQESANVADEEMAEASHVSSSEDDEEDTDSDSESSSPSDTGDSKANKSDQIPANDSLSLSTPPPERPSEPKEIHPLEALYKRPKSSGTPSKPTPIKTGFSFFADDDNESSDQDALPSHEGADPQTPFSSQDARGRRSRSAAPTPDTAAIGKRFSFSLGRGEQGSNSHYDDIYEEDENYNYDDNYDDMAAVNEPAYVPTQKKQYNNHWENSNDHVNETAVGANEQKVVIKPLADDVEGEETAFSKWFWENRGDSNRGWKKRRREVLKVGRQRENRRLGRKMV